MKNLSRRFDIRRLVLATVVLTWGYCGYLLSGCATLDRGADPLIVRTEQTEKVAFNTFDALVSIDDADRGFWRTNLPALHRFAEWLREPQVVDVTNRLARGLAICKRLDTVKLVYKSNKAQTNATDLATALATTEAALFQAQQFVAQTTANSGPPK